MKALILEMQMCHKYQHTDLFYVKEIKVYTHIDIVAWALHLPDYLTWV